MRGDFITRAAPPDLRCALQAVVLRIPDIPRTLEIPFLSAQSRWFPLP